MYKITNRLQAFNFEGGLYDVFQKALELEAQGKKIIHMEIGKPDFDSPVAAKEEVKDALDKGIVHYTPMAGIPELRQAIAGKVKRDNGIDADPKSEIMVTAGACEAISAIMLTLLNPGDEILIPSPFFPAYSEQAIIVGANLVPVPLRMENEFRLQVEDIEERITPRTKILLINTPNNPTGAILELDDLQKIAKLAQERDLIVISDECYDEFVFEGKHISIATLPGMKERTITINSASKAFSMTGWRVAYAIGPSPIIKYATKVHQNLSTCATSFAQVGAVEAYNNGKEFTKGMVSEFKRRRELICDYLSQMKGIEFVVPKGAFYVFPSIKNLCMDEMNFCNYILEEAGVAIVPGNSFGEYGKGFVRMCYACSYEQIEEAMQKMKAAIEKL